MVIPPSEAIGWNPHMRGDPRGCSVSRARATAWQCRTAPIGDEPSELVTEFVLESMTANGRLCCKMYFGAGPLGSVQPTDLGVSPLHD